MPSPRIARTVAAAVRQPREGMSPSHLAMVRDLTCCVCGSGLNIHAHHLLRADPNSRGMGMKNADRWAIPLCQRDHDALHQHGGEEEFLMEHGIDGRALAAALWAERGDVDGMRRVAFRFAQTRRTA